MADKKGWGSTVVGWFVVQDEHAAGATNADQTTEPTEASGSDIADELLRKYSTGGSSPATARDVAAVASSGTATTGGALPSSSEFFQKQPPAATGGQVDFEAVFDAAGVDAEERGRVSKAVELLKSLPAGTDVAVKKQIVEASLRAFGVPVEKIIEAGAEEIQALEFYQRGGADDTEKLIGESEQRIRDLEQEIADIRKIMQERVEEQQAVIRSCNEKKLEVQQILEFFGQERVAAVVKASPKLHDPAAGPTT